MIRVRRRLRWSGSALRPVYGDFDTSGRWLPCTHLTPVCLGRSYGGRCTCLPKPDPDNRRRIRCLLRENADLKRNNEMLAREVRGAAMTDRNMDCGSVARTPGYWWVCHGEQKQWEVVEVDEYDRIWWPGREQQDWTDGPEVDVWGPYLGRVPVMESGSIAQLAQRIEDAGNGFWNSHQAQLKSLADEVRTLECRSVDRGDIEAVDAAMCLVVQVRGQWERSTAVNGRAAWSRVRLVLCAKDIEQESVSLKYEDAGTVAMVLRTLCSAANRGEVALGDDNIARVLLLAGEIERQLRAEIERQLRAMEEKSKGGGG